MSLLGPPALLAEQQFYPFSPSYSKPSQSNFEHQRYYWRPLNGEEAYKDRFRNDWEASFDLKAQVYRGELDSPHPNGGYRQLPQTQGSTPYSQGFRFRPLNQAEQLRMKSRQSTNLKSYPSNRYRPLKPSGDRAIGFSAENQYRFRPDSRLDRGQGNAQPRYSLERQLYTPYPNQ